VFVPEAEEWSVIRLVVFNEMENCWKYCYRTCSLIRQFYFAYCNIQWSCITFVSLFWAARAIFQ
jgi:hypothetical protein